MISWPVSQGQTGSSSSVCQMAICRASSKRYSFPNPRRWPFSARVYWALARSAGVARGNPCNFATADQKQTLIRPFGGRIDGLADFVNSRRGESTHVGVLADDAFAVGEID